MLTLYTAIGTLKFVKNTDGKSTPMVLNNHQEFGLCDHELILWSCLAFQILQIHELESAYNVRLKNSGRPDGLAFSHYLNRLLLRGLIAKGEGVTGVDALYQLLGKLHILPVHETFSTRLFTCIQLYVDGKIKPGDFGKYLRKEKNTPIEETVLKLTKTIPLTTAELVTCVDQKKVPKQEEDVLTQLYDGTEDTYLTLADQAQILHIQYPVLQAVGNLYLKKQISFQRF